MKVFSIPALIAALALTFIPACGPPAPAQLKTLAVCNGRPHSNLSGLQKDYTPLAANTCKETIKPFDISAWIEAPLNSHKLRGLQTLVLGCTNLVPDKADCNYSGLPGHASTLHFNFDFTIFPDQALVQRAVLALNVKDNAAFFTDAAEIRGRLNIGDTLSSLGAKRKAPPLPAKPGAPHQGWIIIDITDLAARAINERRNSVSFEISLPCGRTESELTTVSLTPEPLVLVEYK